MNTYMYALAVPLSKGRSKLTRDLIPGQRIVLVDGLEAFECEDEEVGELSVLEQSPDLLTRAQASLNSSSDDHIFLLVEGGTKLNGLCNSDRLLL